MLQTPEYVGASLVVHLKQIFARPISGDSYSDKEYVLCRISIMHVADFLLSATFRLLNSTI